MSSIDKAQIILLLLLTAIVVGVVVFYFTAQYVCANSISAIDPHTLPIPTYEYIPSQ